MSTLGAVPQWDLSDLYAGMDDPNLASDCTALEKDIAEFAINYQGKITGLNADELAETIVSYEQIEDAMGRIGSYIYLVYAENMEDEKRSSFYQKYSETLNDLGTPLIFYSLELNQIEDNALEALYKVSEKLKHYQPWLRDLRAYRPYQLQENEEKILHQKSITARQSWHRLFEETFAAMRFDFDGRKITSTEIMDKLSSPDETIRKQAAQNFGAGLKNDISLLTMITNVLAKDKAIDDDMRGFKAPISSRNLSNLVEDNITEALLESVQANYKDTAHKYYAYKAKLMGKEVLDYWDRNAPLPGQEEEKISWEEASEIVCSAYAEFSPEIGALCKKFFDNPWIDAKVVPGKESGAFSHPTVPSAHPYILMNYQGKLRDVMTLAHEVGHGIHQLLSAKQGALMADTPLTLAETASVFGEQLTFRKLLDRCKDQKQRKILIANKVEDMLNTVVRQVAFCLFERDVHDARKQGEVSTEELGKIWMKHQQASLGPAIRFHDEYQYYWSYIPHFIHTPFYVYAYAFGDCLVNSLYGVYEEAPQGFAEKYKTMLQAGGSLRHKELLAPFGLYAGDRDFWDKGMGLLRHFIEELDG